MNKSGQIILLLLSLIFTTYQKIMYHEPFFTFDFFLFTLIAWFVGWQYDKARFFEKKARESEESYKRLLDSLPESIFIYQDTKIVYGNRAALSMVGAKNLAEVLGKSIFEFITPEYKERLEERIKLIKKEKCPLATIEYKIKRTDGTEFFLEVTPLSIVFGKKEAILVVGKDVTARREETERLLQKSEKLALLGQMAAGIAHEIRNPLTSIKGFIQLFKANSEQGEYYDIVLSELERINAIVGEFLVLAKPSAAVFKEQNIELLLHDVITLINTQSIINNVQIYTEIAEELPMISGEENQLKQVFLNLLKNSIESMPLGGDIFVTVGVKEEGKISIRITDEGVGIPEERILTLGEPFYTTKEKGTGLGLMTCFKIVEGHRGQIKFTSAVHQGTTVEVTLPTITQPLLKK
ncbi:ATP-binding protein [Neobacillus sp. SAB-20_R2A]|uniref:ATP-binding protein n=1 Tax=Neobacillus sp. SAB-20_R2A TaxID=3120519 RepID=UPI003C6E09F2